MRSTAAFLTACALAGLAPLLPRGKSPVVADAFPGWPKEFDGRPLAEQQLGPRELRFAESFPGRIASFTDGRRQILLRWVNRPSRQLHSAPDCLRGAGYSVFPKPLWRDSLGRIWGATSATRDTMRLRVLERIVDAKGLPLTDASSWYWSAMLGRSEGPWWAWTVMEVDPPPATTSPDRPSG